MTMKEREDALKKEISTTEEWLKNEYASIRTGRATPVLLDGISVEAYGSRMRLSQISSISVSDARTLFVSPYDSSQIKMIEKAITVADLGVSVGSDEKGVRVSFPELTTERRGQLMKLVKAKLEEARVALKQKRVDALKALEKEELSEDEERREKDAIQKVIDLGNEVLEREAEKKEKELEG